MEKVRRILVPVKGEGLDDDEAIRFACAIAKRDKAKVVSVYVIEVPRALPLDAEVSEAIEEGERSLQRAEAVAEEVEGEIESEILQARLAGPAIVDEANERGIDLIIVGLPYRTRLGEFQLGNTATYVLKNARCRVWLCRVQMEGNSKT
jgi:nucleotide-binding universal stress UspA family protein